ncbi:beta-lactamase regulating signal transducer with metallopeptidase domain [Flavobacterium gossypii]|uniref:Beta-lactamase regulating signal transducer with metallopeptidase domain n=1 Tax=Flavobacterium gossypii TaxID=1646119 RepID=A0ABR6DPV0_9FLAO|nr:M56 family metallopeptidase [Flavobacterium gossypii]MBA9073704.1 beta-lactamase regulating signal transducer with metallopeptidase domain [Flavobacterium gossypii]
MIDFLIKSTISLTLLLGLYHLFLEKEKMHTFNRFYLLFSLLFSFALPFITIEIAVESISKPLLLPNPILTKNETVAIIKQEDVNYIPILLWSLYAAVTIFFIVRFGKNIYALLSKVRKNRTVSFFYSTLVLVREKSLPHTFLQYIFINGDDYNNRNIQEELYTHELTHVRQRHSYDILFIEIIKTVFWFNPLLLLYKKAIQLNHEFLADEKVVESYNNVPFYQSLLLQKASWNNNFYLASNLNFSVTKKRLIMMTKKTSKNIAIAKKLALLPLLTGIIYFTCVKTVAQEKVMQNTAKKEALNEKDKREASYYAGTRFIIYKYGIQTKKGVEGKDIIFNKVYEELTAEDKERLKVWLFLVPKGYVKNSPTQKELDGFKNVKNYAIWVDGVNVRNSELNKFKPSDIAYFSGSVILKNARTKKHPQPFQYSFYTHDYFDKNEMGKDPEKYAGDKMEVFEKIIKKKANPEIKLVPYKANKSKKENEKTEYVNANGQTL